MAALVRLSALRPLLCGYKPDRPFFLRLRRGHQLQDGIEHLLELKGLNVRSRFVLAIYEKSSEWLLMALT